MRECKLCRKIFSGAGGKVCGDCAKDLDELYKEVRTYIRDHEKEDLDVEMIADGMDVDIRKVQELVDMGYLSRELPGASASDTSKEDRRQEKLAKQLEESVKQLAANAARKGAATYGQQRHGGNTSK